MTVTLFCNKVDTEPVFMVSLAVGIKYVSCVFIGLDICKLVIIIDILHHFGGMITHCCHFYSQIILLCKQCLQIVMYVRSLHLVC